MDHHLHNAMRPVRMNRPDGRMPREIIFDLRVQTVKAGRDPGIPLDLQLTAGELWSKAPEGSPVYQWLHPEEIIYVTMGMAGNWRHRNSDNYKQRVFEAARACNGRMNCSSNHEHS